MFKYFQSVRDELQESGLVFQKTNSVAETLNENDIAYPFFDSIDTATMDGIMADNGQLLWKEMNKFAKRLSSKLSNDVQAEGDRFILHNSFKITGLGKGESVKYVPFTLNMDDGQVLTALAKNVKNLKTFNPKQDMEITHWFLNKQDITKAVYFNGDRNIDEATTSTRLQTVIEGFHRRFISGNPINVDADALRKEIDGMVLDLSDVVFGGNEDTKAKAEEFNKKFDEMMAEKYKSGEARDITFATAEEANDFAIASGRAIRKGHSIKDNKVSLSGLNGEDNAWINSYIANLAKNKLQEEAGSKEPLAIDNEEETKTDRFYVQSGGAKSGWNNTRYIIRDRENKNNGSDEIAGFVRYGNDTPEIDLKYRDNEELMKFIENNFSKKDEDKQAQKEDYTVTLPSGAEKYVNAIKGAFAQDSDLKDLKASFNVGGTVMDAIEKSQIVIEGESSKIKTKMMQTIYFASIGYDKIEGKEGARMPSVELIRNAEYIKEKTGVDYEIRHHQTATFETQKIEIDMNEAGKSNSLFLPIGRFESWSVKERWLASGMNRKRTIEYILEQLKDEAKGNTTEEPKTEDESELSAKLEAIKGFMGEAQYSILKSAINKPNNEFEDVINELYQTITTMPKTYEQDGKGNEAVAYLHYFKGGNDWWITEKDMGTEQLQAFGLASMNGYEPELGYISIEELKSVNAELDFYWEPKTVGEIKGQDEDEDEDEYQEDYEEDEADKEFEVVKEKAKAKQLDVVKEVDNTYTVLKVENIVLSVVIDRFPTLLEAEDFIDNYGKEKEQPKMETKDRFGAGSMGGADTTMWDTEKQENGDYKIVGTITRGHATMRKEYENDADAIEYAKRMGAITFEHEAGKAKEGAGTDYSKYQGALSRILLASIDTLDDVEMDIEIIENAYNANPDDEELKNIYQQVSDKLDEMAGI